MQDVLTRFSALRRPRLLIRAARAGSDDYARNQHLRRIIGGGELPRHGAALTRLLELEAEVNTQRKAGSAAYSIVRHVDLLIAMMGEARLLRATRLS